MRNDYDELIDAIGEYDIPLVHSILQNGGTFTAEEIYRLCDEAMTVQCETDLILEIMKYGPSVDELLTFDPNISLISGQDSGFPELVICRDRSDILRYLLDQGFIPNRRHDGWSSALEIALHYNAPRCVHELLRCPGIDTTITEQMRLSWGRLGMELPRGFPALCEIAGELFTLDPKKLTSCDDIPLLPGMTVLHAAHNRNWPLLGRMCRTQGITQTQCDMILEQYEQQWYAISLDSYSGSINEQEAVRDAATLLDTLFSVQPDLLQWDYPRSMLTICMLKCDEEATRILKPWWDQMPGSELVLKTIGYGPWAKLLTDGLKSWKDVIGTRFTPVLTRSNPIPFTKGFQFGYDDIVRKLLPRCQIRGEIPEAGLSQLAQSLITISARHFPDEAKKILAPENADAVSVFQAQTWSKIKSLRNELALYE